ncbi:MAG: cupin domain-containing protein [Myxococcales bacterium]|nr:cupin domain-containing protein [Myxococcales bacterium]
MTNTRDSYGLNPSAPRPGARFSTLAPGVEMSVLRLHESGGMSFLIRMAKGARAPLHHHPGGEETFMIQGALRIEHRVDASGAPLADAVVPQGTYLFAPPGETHDGLALEDCLFFVVAPGGVARHE